MPRNDKIKYVIEYEHLQDELIKNRNNQIDFNRVKNAANKYSVELSDDDFRSLFELSANGRDIDWMLHKMGVYKKTLVQALIAYISYT